MEIQVSRFCYLKTKHAPGPNFLSRLFKNSEIPEFKELPEESRTTMGDRLFVSFYKINIFDLPMVRVQRATKFPQ